MKVQSNTSRSRISILGCGWLGLPLARKLAEVGYRVNGSTRSIDKTDQIKKAGTNPYLLDIARQSAMDQSFLDSDILIILITSKSLDDFKKLIRNIENSSIKKVVYVSSTSVYAADNETVTEDTPAQDVPLARIESLFRENNNFETTIIRFAGLFGYDRQPGNFIKTDRPIGNPEGYVNLIHRDDCLEILIRIIAEGPWGETLNACTDEHPNRRQFYIQERKKVGRPAVFEEASGNAFKIVSNDKLKNMLDFQFLYSKLMDSNWP